LPAPATETAIAEVRSLALSLGLESTPVVVADRSNLVLRLDPHPLIARVAMATSMVRVGMAWLRREVDLSRFLDGEGAAVTRPSELLAAGPFEQAGLVISFWQLEELRPELDAMGAGARLAEAHRLLRGFPHERVPEWGGWLEAREVLALARTNPLLAPVELARLLAAWEQGEQVVASARARTASFQTIHGDAHLGNALATTRGAVWTDWEDAFLGPVEWDLACLRSRLDLMGEDRQAIEAASAAYDTEHDPVLVRELGLVRNLQVIPWLAVFAARDPSLLPRMRARIARLP
jgi:hypothetical protein